MLQALGLYPTTQTTAYDFFKSQKLNPQFVREFVDAVSRINYGQNGSLNAFVDLVSMAGAGMVCVGVFVCARAQGTLDGFALCCLLLRAYVRSRYAGLAKQSMHSGIWRQIPIYLRLFPFVGAFALPLQGGSLFSISPGNVHVPRLAIHFSGAHLRVSEQATSVGVDANAHACGKGGAPRPRYLVRSQTYVLGMPWYFKDSSHVNVHVSWPVRKNERTSGV